MGCVHTAQTPLLHLWITGELEGNYILIVFYGKLNTESVRKVNSFSRLCT